jgi:hypothetical protein
MPRHLFILILASLLIASEALPLLAGDTKNTRLLTPRQSPAGRQLSDDKEPFIERSGGVRLNLSTLMKSTASPADNSLGKAKSKGVDQQEQAIEIALFPDTVYQVIVDSVSHEANGATIWSGHLAKGEGTFILVNAPDGYILTIKDGDKLFRSSGDAITGEGLVREIHLDRIPPTYDEAPDIVPGEDHP